MIEMPRANRPRKTEKTNTGDIMNQTMPRTLMLIALLLGALPGLSLGGVRISPAYLEV